MNMHKNLHFHVKIKKILWRGGVLLYKGQSPLHQFSRNKSAASPQHKQVCNNLSLTKVRCVCCVVSFSKFHYNNLLLTSWPQQVCNKLVTFPSSGIFRGKVCNGFWAYICDILGVFGAVIVLVQTQSAGGSHVCLARPITAQLSVTSFHLVCSHCPAVLM